MDRQNQEDFSNNNVAPFWRKSAHQKHLHAKNKPRPRSYQSSTGVLFTDFPVEDKDTFTLTQPAETVTTSADNKSMQGSPLLYSCTLGSVPNGKVDFLDHGTLSPRLSDQSSPQVLKMVSNNSANFTASSPTDNKLVHPVKLSNQLALRSEKEQMVFTSRLGLSPTENSHLPNYSATTALVLQPSQLPKNSEKESLCLSALTEQQQPLQRLVSNQNEVAETIPVVLSTNSLAALKVGKQQIIPKGLASEVKVTNKTNYKNAESSRRVLKVRSMVETPSMPLVGGGNDELEGDVDSPGVLRRGLRSTSYRRAVVSGIDLDNTVNIKKKNRMSQPVLKAVMEDKEKVSSLGRIKVSKLLITFHQFVMVFSKRNYYCVFHCLCSAGLPPFFQSI